jgi:hypothetical protein
LRLDELVREEVGKAPADGREDLEQEASLPVGASRMWFRIRNQGPESQEILSPGLRVRVEAKSGRIDDRILAENFNLFNELSRSRNEAHLKAALIPVVLILAAALIVREQWNTSLAIVAILAAISIAVGLFLEALALRGRAREIALRAVVDGLVSTPTLDLIRDRVAGMVTPSPKKTEASPRESGRKGFKRALIQNDT